MTDRSIDRRVFVKAGGLALVSLGIDPIFLTRAAYAVRRPDGPANARKTLICVFQRGAVDGLNMIVPHGDPSYYQDRPGIAIGPPGKPGGALDLDGYFGLHPTLAPLLPYYHDGSLAIVHAVGSPYPSRSHFDAQGYMESGTPGVKSTRDGWLNRYMAHARDHQDTPFRSVAMGAQLPHALRGSSTALAIDNLQTFGIRTRANTQDRVASAFEELYRGSASGLVASSAEEGFEAIRMLKAANPSAFQPENGARYPTSTFGRQMRQLAQLVKARIGLEIGFADVGGWDTHVNQGAGEGQLAGRLRDFGRTIAAFAQDLGPRMADVVVLTMSEFGRTVSENGNRGTDHGRATAMLVLGGNANGGKVHGRWPTLAPEKREYGRDLAVTTDFRDLFGEVLVGHLGSADLSAVFPGYKSDPKRWVGAMRR
ncbi:MAG: DUF1501 domain-containing protein [Gemmatimonadetes bacterium]|nr:DUF1501 domain-containing protein [Gemmatimonadota bacterium]